MPEGSRNTTTRPSRSKTRSARAKRHSSASPEDDAGGALYRRARLDRTKLEQIAERWEETSADLMMTESILRIEKTTAKSRLEIALELESAGPPLYRQLTYTDTPPVTSTDTKTMGDVLDRLERCAPPSGITCIQGARDTPRRDLDRGVRRPEASRRTGAGNTAGRSDHTDQDSLETDGQNAQRPEPVHTRRTSRHPTGKTRRGSGNRRG